MQSYLRFTLRVVFPGSLVLALIEIKHVQKELQTLTRIQMVQPRRSRSVPKHGRKISEHGRTHALDIQCSIGHNNCDHWTDWQQSLCADLVQNTQEENRRPLLDQHLSHRPGHRRLLLPPALHIDPILARRRDWIKKFWHLFQF